jgi:aromatic-amino-acid transaminase
VNDSLIALIAMVNADPRPDKIDVGVGVFRDSAGNTPILKVIKDAEQRLLDTQVTKAYLGSAGDKRFAELLRPILLGEHAGDPRIVGVQTPGGCGALRLGFELLARANPQARVFVGTPTWPNHPPIIKSVGLEQADYPYYERGQGAIRFEDMIDALGTGAPGDIALLHGCCHNPTGADLDEDQWREIARVVADRGLVPFVDIAYQGFGRGLDEDAFGLRLMLDTCDEVIAAQSCDKNFSVYRDRVGSLWIKSALPETSAAAMGHVFQIAREMWSMPPDHGAASVRIILDDSELKARWLVELTAMRDRINAVRRRIAAADPRLAFIGRQFGMFSMLPLSKDQVLKLRTDHAIYMAESGRFNVVGMGDAQIDRFIAAVVEALDA